MPVTTFSLHDMYDGNEPKIDLAPELAEAIKEREPVMRPRSANAYRCTACGRTIRTEELHIGVTPARIACNCGDSMASAGHPFPVPDWLGSMPVTHEWYRPGKDEVANLAREDRDYVIERGGLLLREKTE